VTPPPSHSAARARMETITAECHGWRGQRAPEAARQADRQSRHSMPAKADDEMGRKRNSQPSDRPGRSFDHPGAAIDRGGRGRPRQARAAQRKGPEAMEPTGPAPRHQLGGARQQQRLSPAQIAGVASSESRPRKQRRPLGCPTDHADGIGPGAAVTCEKTNVRA